MQLIRTNISSDSVQLSYCAEQTAWHGGYAIKGRLVGRDAIYTPIPSLLSRELRQKEEVTIGSKGFSLTKQGFGDAQWRVYKVNARVAPPQI